MVKASIQSTFNADSRPDRNTSSGGIDDIFTNSLNSKTDKKTSTAIRIDTGQEEAKLPEAIQEELFDHIDNEAGQR